MSRVPPDDAHVLDAVAVVGARLAVTGQVDAGVVLPTLGDVEEFEDIAEVHGEALVAHVVEQEVALGEGGVEVVEALQRRYPMGSPVHQTVYCRVAFISYFPFSVFISQKTT